MPHQEADPIFVGRQWLVSEILNAITTSDCKGVLINGNLGSGKTMFMLQLVENSCFGRKKEARDLDGIYNQVNVAQERLCELADKVVAYHFCQSDNSPTCAVPDFVHSLAAQLCQSPQLAAYNEFLLSEPHLQNVLSIKECITDPQRSLKMGILEPLDLLKRQGKILSRYCIILIDALCESEYHAPDYGDTITSFMSTMCHSFPPWLKVVSTVRTQMIEYTSSLPFVKITLDKSHNDSLQKDILDYINLRMSHSASIQNNISNVSSNGTHSISREGSSKFSHHLVVLSNGSFLFAKLTLDLIERGSLVIKSNSFKVLPVTLSQIFLLSFNLRYPTQSGFEKVAPILAVCLAALHPLTLLEIFHSVNSLVTEVPLEWNEFLNRFKMLAGFLVKRIDNSYMFFHPSFREWLSMRRDEGESFKFLCDLKTGHAAIAFRMSRLQAPLDEENTLELCHHILKAHIYRNPPLSQASPRDLQAYWVTSSSQCVSKTLSAMRNVYNPNFKVSRLLLLAGANPDHQTNYFGDAPLLCIVAHEGIIGMVNLLLEFGADVEKTNNQGFTPLILASIKGHYEIVQQLVTSGSSLGQTDAQKRCALVHAALNGHVHIVKYLLACDWLPSDTRNDSTLLNSSKQALVSAASRGHSLIVEDLLATLPELDVDAIDYITGESSLTIASTNGHTETVSVLLSRGANHDKKNRKGMTALLLASKEGHWNIVERLIQCGANVEQKDVNGRNSLMISAEEGHVGILELLLNKGAQLDVVDKDGLNPLSWACLRGKISSAKSLLGHNADIHHQDNHQRTPLDLASYQGSGELVQLLLENGAQIEHVDEKGMRPIDRAIACRNIKVCQVFLKHGAKLGSSTWFLSQSKPEIM